jgi:serine protease Do
MDPNEYQNGGGDDSGKYYRYQYGADQQPGGYYYNPYNPYGAPGGRPPERKGLRRALIAIIMVVCLIAGSAIGVYWLSPGFGVGNQSGVAVSEPSATQPMQTQPVQQSASPPDGSLTTDSAQIGGDSPNISVGESPYVQIAEKVGPAVVVVRIDNPSEPDEFDPQGTGIIITKDGYIVTNNHVVADRGANSIVVVMEDGTEYKAGLVGMDETTDLAVLKINVTGLTAAALGDSDQLKVGEVVVAIGNALGMGSGTVTTGIISGLNKEIYASGYSQEYIQTDAAINPGNSGGPLINMAGEVVGIITLKSYIAEYDASGQAVSSEGIGFAIPINTAIPVIQQLVTKGSVERPGIGITCLVDKYNEYNPSGAPEGVTVVSVTEGGPADLAGIEANDIITKADGVKVTSVDELTSIIKGHEIGDKLSLTVWRDGTEHQASVTVGDLNQLS